MHIAAVSSVPSNVVQDASTESSGYGPVEAGMHMCPVQVVMCTSTVPWNSSTSAVLLWSNTVTTFVLSQEQDSGASSCVYTSESEQGLEASAVSRTY